MDCGAEPGIRNPSSLTLLAEQAQKRRVELGGVLKLYYLVRVFTLYVTRMLYNSLTLCLCYPVYIVSCNFSLDNRLF